MRGGLCSKSNKKVIERTPRSNLLPILLPCSLRKNCLKCCQRRLDQSSINAPNPSEFEEIKDFLHSMWRSSLSTCNEDSGRMWELQLPYDCQVSFGIVFSGKERLVPRQFLLVVQLAHSKFLFSFTDSMILSYMLQGIAAMNFSCKRSNPPFFPVDNKLLPLVQENTFLVCFQYIFFISLFAYFVFHSHLSPRFPSPKKPLCLIGANRCVFLWDIVVLAHIQF